MTVTLQGTPEDGGLFPVLTPYRSRVYFGLAAERGGWLIKIGLTSRRKGRRGGELHFEELCAVPGDEHVEAEYHRRYASLRFGQSEWFKLAVKDPEDSDRLLGDLLVMCIEQGRERSVQLLRNIILEREWPMPDAA